MRSNALTRRVLVGILFLSLFMGGFGLSLCPTTANAEGGITDPILGDSSGSSEPAPSNELSPVFWAVCITMLNSLP